MLVQLFMMVHNQHPLLKVEIGRQDAMNSFVPLEHNVTATDPYPPRWPKVPFQLEIDENFYDSPTLYIIFKRLLSDEEQVEIDGLILTWGIIDAACNESVPLANSPPLKTALNCGGERLKSDRLGVITIQNRRKFRGHQGLLNQGLGLELRYMVSIRIRLRLV